MKEELMTMGTCPTCGQDTLPEEPADRSIVLDVENDAWQRLGDGWSCVLHDADYRQISWGALNALSGPLRVVFTP